MTDISGLKDRGRGKLPAMRWILAACCALVPVAPVQAPPQHWGMLSTDLRTEFRIDTQADGSLVWSLRRDKQVVIADSPLGLRRADQAFETGLTSVGMSHRDIDDRYTTPFGKRRDHHVTGREWTLTFANRQRAQLDVIVRIHGDGVAFRYRFPGQGEGVKSVVDERTGFHLPQGSTAWLMPQQEVHKYGPAYEDFYVEMPSGTAAPRRDGWAFPALFKTGTGTWLLLT